jgi:GT2 family glycosyltransferase
VLIVNRNGAAHLPGVLRAVGAQTLPPARVLVVDNGSGDGSADGLEAHLPGVEVLRLGENAGFARANNVGAARLAGCDWLALLNPDAYPEPGWLAAIARAIADHPDTALLASRLVLRDDPGRLDGTGDEYHVSGIAWRRDHGRGVEEAGLEPGEVFSPCGAAALVRADAWAEAGGFDERFFCYFEDVDLALRLRLAGHRCRYVPDATVLHVGSATTGRDSDFTIYHSHRNLVWVWARGLPAPLAVAYLPQHLLMSLLGLGWFATRGQLGVYLRAKRDALRGLPAVLGERRALHGDRRVGSRELLAVLARGRSGYGTAASRARAAVAAARPRSLPGDAG